jgi:small GTP-binding protein
LSFDQRKLEVLLKWYRKEAGKSLIASLVVKNDGSIVEKLTRYTIEEENEKLIASISEIVKVIIERIEDDFRLGSFGAGTFDTAEYRFIFCKAGPDHVLITLINPLSFVDNIIPYSYLTAEKVARVFDGRTVSPVIPRIISSVETQNIQRQIGSFQKITVASPEYAYKIILVGDGAVGKTSMVHRFVEGSFQTDYKATIGTSIMKKECHFEGLESKVRLVLWDLAGQDQFMRVRQSYLTNAEAGFLVYDVTRRKSFDNIKKWKKELDNANLEDAALILIGNKTDLEDERMVSTEEGRELAKELKISFIETSAKTGQHVDDSFRALALQMIKGKFVTEKFEVTYVPEPIEEPITPIVEEEDKKIILEGEFNYIQRKRFEFWDDLIVKIKDTSVKIPLLKDGLIFTYVIADDWSGIELCFCHKEYKINQKRFKIFESYKEDIQKELANFSWYISNELEWDYDEYRDIQRIMLRFKNYGLNDVEHWDKIHSKMIDGMKALVKSLQNYVEKLDLP